MADAISSGSWFIVLEVLALNINISTVFLHLSKLGLGSDFSNIGAREDVALCPAVYCILVIYGVAASEQYVVNFLIFLTSGGISSKPAAFLFLIFLRTTSSSCVSCLSLISCKLLMIFVIRSSVPLGNFPSRFLKCCLHRYIRSSWLAVFSFALVLLLLLLTSFTVCHAILSSTEFLTLLIWFVMYSICSFSSRWRYLDFPYCMGYGFHAITPF